MWKCFTAAASISNIVKILTSKTISKIFNQMMMKWEKMAKNTSQWAIGTWISRSIISENLSTFQITENVLDRQRCNHPQMLLYRNGTETDEDSKRRLQEKWWMIVTSSISCRLISLNPSFENINWKGALQLRMQLYPKTFESNINLVI